MNELDFAGRVAVVTGAGRGIGRAYALLLARRGADVVVNDLGGTMQGLGKDLGPASAVATEITGGGGSAIADDNDVSAPDGAIALIDRAIGTFGRVDILVNNAGIVRWAGLPEADLENLEQHIAVHVTGSFNTTRAAWSRMVDQGYGRIVMTGSTGMLGLPTNTSYATAKAAVIGLARSLATAGATHGIKVNVVAPAAFTRMAGPPGTDPASLDTDPRATTMSPDLVAPLVAFLAHETCPVTGEVYTAGAGRFGRIFIASTAGYLHEGLTPTVEDVARNWAAVNDESGYYVPSDLTEWSAVFMSHLKRA